MISIELMFYLAVLLFGGIGAIRGWQKEVIAMAGLIGSIAFLHQFGATLANYGSPLVSFLSGTSGDPTQREIFWVQFLFHITIAFFSYQIIGSIADRAPGRRGEQFRSGFQNAFIGFVIGVINGFFLFGTLWAFLEYQIVNNGEKMYVRYDQNVNFFAPYIDRTVNVATIFNDVVNYLPLNLFTPGVWLLVFFFSFFIVIIALV